MEAMSKLSTHVGARLAQLREMKNKGTKIVGYIPNGYVPEELVYACGAIPAPLIRGGDSSVVEASVSYLGRFMDNYCRAQIGYHILQKESLYQMLDLLIVPITDNHVRAIAESWGFYSNVDLFRLGVPHAKTEQGFKHYLEGIYLLKEKLEVMTGVEITDKRLRDEIRLTNKMRNLLREISLMRKAEHPPITGKDFIKLMHNSFYADRRILIELLESLYEELKLKNAPDYAGGRVMLTGSTLALGDYKILDLLEEAGASIVIEEFSEGLRDYWQTVENDLNPVRALAKTYFTNKIPGAFFRGSATERFDYLLRLTSQFKVNGVVWYSLMYRDSYDIEAYLFPSRLKEVEIPMLNIKSDYSAGEIGALRTRIEAFIEIIEGR